MSVWKNSRQCPGRARHHAIPPCTVAGRSIQQISQIERGEREPKLSTLILLAHALGMEPGILVNEAAKVMQIPQAPITAVE